MTASKFAAKVDNAAVRAGHQLYHHTFGFTPSGSWCVVQQGCRMRRGPRAHRLSDSLASFVDEQHTAVCCDACVAQLKMVASGGICVPAQ